MFIRLLLVLIAFSSMELYLLFKINAMIGFPYTIILIFLTAFAGVYLLRIQGLEILQRLSFELSTGKLPKKELIDGGLILIGGFLLLLPGFFSDLLGFVFLFPWPRAAFRHLFLLYWQRKISRGMVRFYFSP